MATRRPTSRKIDAKSLQRALDGPPKPIVVYQFPKNPKVEKPNKNPYG